MRISTSLSALAFTATAAAASFGVQAQSIDVRVIGTVTPPACIPTLAGGGVVDYGRVAASSLNRTAVNPLQLKTLAFSINCNVPTRVALRSVDNRAASRISNLPGVEGDHANYGLGTVTGANVGGYVLRMRQGTFTADGANVFTVLSTNSGTTWIGTNQGAVFHRAPDRISWSLTAGGQPIAFSTLSGNFTVQTILNRGDALPLANEVPLDGLATIEMLYL